MKNPILEQLDAAAEEFAMPGPPNMNYPVAGVRMHGLIGPGESSLLCFQVLNYGRQVLRFFNTVYLFGQDVDEPGVQHEEEVLAPADGSFWDEDGASTLDPLSFTVMLRQERRSFTLTARDYTAAGIDLDEMDPELAMMRVLAHRIPDEMFFNVDQLLQALARPGFSELFQLSEWTQPDLSEEEKPSDIPCFKQIVVALDSRKADGLTACAKKANTHWSNWLAEE